MGRSIALSSASVSISLVVEDTFSGEPRSKQGVRLHDLRHAHATILLQQGVHPKIVQESLSHNFMSTTLDIYSHVLPGLQEAAARRFGEGLKGISPEPQAAQVPQRNG